MAIAGQLALAEGFLSAFARLPAQQQRRVSAMLVKFRADPTSTGLNFERVRQALSPNVRSIRLGKGYRAILQQAPRGDGHLLLWADKHDEAYKWAARHRCDINPETGALQIYSPSVPHPPQGPQASPPQTVQPTGPFAALKSRQLVRLGVPEAMVGELHAAQGDAEDFLESIKPRLPREAYEGLFYFLAGTSYEDILRERETSDDPVDTSDFVNALQRRESQARFRFVDSQRDLEAMLNAPLEKWRVFLHPTQQQIANRDWNGPVRVLGAAGTGKTVVAMHRARWLARKCQPEERILFVTFNRNLAKDIRQNLRQICTDEEMGRINVQNLDAWTYAFLKRHEYEFRITFKRDQQAWEEALSQQPADLALPRGFYEAELERVVQANGVQTLAGYKRVSRVGRGTPLHRSARVKVWKVFETYQQVLAANGLRARDDAYQDAIDLIREGPQGPPFLSVIVDEAQDLGPQAFRLIRALAPPGKNDLFITGDCHQRIYGSKIVLGRCGIDIRGRSRKLRLNYRTTEETRSWAALLLEGREIDDLDGGRDDNRNIQSLTTGPAPLVRNFETAEAQFRAVAEYLQGLVQHGTDLRDVCVVARTIKVRDAARDAISSAGIPAVAIEAAGDDRESKGVRVATMHRVKGLEFERVAVVSANAGVLPLTHAIRGATDDGVLEEAEIQERALLYVAASRAKQELLVLSHGTPSPFLATQAREL
ncbi:MAG: AAA family ATPase [Bryobacterales bacterium]|nr:AAA family ATPase [Bryobacterales bacterium]